MKEIDFPIEVIKNKNQKIQKMFIKGVEVPTKTLFDIINHQIVSGGLDEVTLKFYTDDFYIGDHEEEK